VSRFFPLMMMVVLTLVASGCDRPEPLPEPTPDQIAPAPVPEAPPVELPVALGDEQLDFFTYQLPQLGGQVARFRNGEFVDEANLRFGTVVPSPRVKGDFDGDGSPEVALLVVINTGGTGVYVNLVSVGTSGSRAVQEAVLALGDRVEIVSMEYRDRKIHLDMVVHGPDDPLCCPSVREVRQYEQAGSEWRQVGS